MYVRLKCDSVSRLRPCSPSYVCVHNTVSWLAPTDFLSLFPQEALAEIRGEAPAASGATSSSAAATSEEVQTEIGSGGEGIAADMKWSAFPVVEETYFDVLRDQKRRLQQQQ